jgi:hypothetical protein
VEKGLLYAATETGVWVSFNDGDQWRPLEYNLPHTSMRDLLVKDDDLVVATHGRSFWVLDDVEPLREMAAESQAPMLFKPADAWRVRRSEYTDTPMPPDEPMGKNPPDGAPIDYDLPAAAQSVTLQILNSDGKVLRTYTSHDPVTPAPEELKAELIPPYWPLRHGPMPVSAGMHRWVWDLRSKTPTSTRYGYPISAVPYRTPLNPQGPLVVPGTYTVKLTVDGKSETEPVTVKMDPRVHMTQDELVALHSAQMAMSDALTSAAQADLDAHAVEEQLNAPGNADLAAQVGQYKDALDKVLKGDPAQHRPGVDEVSGETGQVYGELEGADAVPTEALLQAAQHVEQEGTEVVPAWESFRTQQLPGLNEVLRKAGRPEINLQKAPEDMPEAGDED